MGIGRLAWIGGALVAAAGIAYGVGCVNNDVVDPCPKYCADIMATCVGDDQQYPDGTTCTRFCASINGRDAGNDSIECRQLSVSSAKDEPDPAVKHKLCVGGGVSPLNCAASQCAAFCASDLALCTIANPPYASTTECEAACATWGQSFDGPLLGSQGDTLQCRTYHLELSQTGQVADLTTHCPHTAANSPRCNSGSDAGAEGGTDAGTDAASDATTD